MERSKKGAVRGDGFRSTVCINNVYLSATGIRICAAPGAWGKTRKWFGVVVVVVAELAVVLQGFWLPWALEGKNVLVSLMALRTLFYLDLVA